MSEAGLIREFDFGDALLSHLKEHAKRTTEACIRRVSSIFSLSRDGEPSHVGSGIWFRTDAALYLVSAAHVLDHASSTQLFFSSGGKLVALAPEWMRTTSLPYGLKRDADKFDFGWVRMPGGLSETLTSQEFFTPDQVSPAIADLEGRMQLVLGFPSSRQKDLHRDSRTVPLNLFAYVAPPHGQETCTKLKLSSAHHLCIKFDKHSRTLEGMISNSIDRKGMSGGPVIDIGDFGMPEVRSAVLEKLTLSGMTIEKSTKHRAHIAVRFVIIAGAILKAERDTRAS